MIYKEGNHKSASHRNFYHNEDRIVSVTESREVNGETETTVTEYTYDAMGQLLTETVRRIKSKFTSAVRNIRVSL